MFMPEAKAKVLASYKSRGREGKRAQTRLKSIKFIHSVNSECGKVWYIFGSSQRRNEFHGVSTHHTHRDADSSDEGKGKDEGDG